MINKMKQISEWKYEELPTPRSKREYIDIAHKIIHAREILLNSDGWEIVSKPQNFDDVMSEKKYIDDSGVAMMRVSGFAKLKNGQTIHTLANELFNPTDESQKRLFDNILMYEKINSITDNIIVSKIIGQVTGISNREFISLRTMKYTDDKYIIAIQSINDENHPFDDNCVRGIITSGIELSLLTDNIVEIKSIEHIDPKGWIPNMVVNAFVTLAGGWINKI